MSLQHKRSSIAHKRPVATSLNDGQLALNLNATSPGVFFKNSSNVLTKVGPVHVGTDAPNSSPATGGSTGNSIGEQWLDTTGGTYVLKIWDGTAWRSESGTFVDVSGDTMTGALILPSGTEAAPALGVGSSDNGLYLPATDELGVSTNGSERLRIDSSGDVLIGTTSGNAERLRVQDNATTGTSCQLSIISGNAERGILNFGDAEDHNIGRISYHHSDNALFFHTNNAERLRIDSSGQVGIGTSAPDGTLHVHSASAGSVTANANADNLVVENNGVGGISVLTPNANTGALFFGSPSDNVGAALRWNHTNNEFAIGPDKSGAHFRFNSGDGLERMRIDSSGNVGVGESSPDLRLHVKETINVAYSADNAVSDANNLLKLENPSTTANAFAGMAFRTGNGADLYFGSIQQSANDGDFYFANHGSPNKELMRIKSTGNVGIGTSAPTTKLHVQQSAVTSAPSRSAALYLENNANCEIQFVGNSSNDCQLRFGTSSNSFKGALEYELDNNNLKAYTDGSERLRIDSDGRLLVGISSASSAVGMIVGKSAGDSIGRIFIGKNDTTIANNNGIGAIKFGGSADETVGAEIKGEADATWTHSSSHPSRLVFSTTASSASSPTERMRIDSSGDVLFFGNIRKDNASSSLTVSGGNGSSSGANIVLNGQSGSPANTVQFRYGSNESMRIDSSGNVGIGATDVNAPLEVRNSSALQIRTSTGTGNYWEFGRDNSTGDFFLADDGLGTVVAVDQLTGNVGIGTTSPNGKLGISDGTGSLGSTQDITAEFRRDDGTNNPRLQIRHSTAGTDLHHTYSTGASNLTFSNAGTERMRIDSSGNLLIGKTVTTSSTQGLQLNGGGFCTFTRNSDPALLINRQSNDGDLVRFYQADALEGSISVSGSTVSYNGAHLARWSQLPGGVERTEILRGSVLSNIDEMCEWGEEDNEQLNRMKVSDVEGDRNVSGVFQAWDDDDDTYTNDFYCAMTGDFVIRIAQGTTVARGDLLMSAGDGTAKPQDDDIVRSKTIAKVTSTTVSTTYTDGSYCVPCVLMAC